MVKTTDLVTAMRCSFQAPTSAPPCTACAYRVVESLDGEEYTSCDCDRMGMDAADKIEDLVERCARYAEEIAVLQDRLAAYENTGLTPEEINDLASVREISPEAEYAINKHADNIIERLDKLLNQTDDDVRLRELAEADKDERVVVLPVKPVLTPIISSMLCIIEDGDIYEDALYEAVVGMSESGKTNVVYTTLSDQMIFEQADIGKTVFLTREEAEKALEAMRKGEAEHA